MKVQVTLEISDTDRLIIAEAYDLPGLATRAFIRDAIAAAYEGAMSKPRRIYEDERGRRMIAVKKSLGSPNAETTES